jgi:hypothetical protein
MPEGPEVGEHDPETWKAASHLVNQERIGLSQATPVPKRSGAHMKDHGNVKRRGPLVNREHPLVVGKEILKRRVKF